MFKIKNDVEEGEGPPYGESTQWVLLFWDLSDEYKSMQHLELRIGGSFIINAS